MKITAFFAVIVVSLLALGFSNRLAAAEKASFDSLYDALYGELADAPPDAQQPIALKAFTIAAQTTGLDFDEQQARRLYFSLAKDAKKPGTEREIGRRMYRILLKTVEKGVSQSTTESVQATSLNSSATSPRSQETKISNAPEPKLADKAPKAGSDSQAKQGSGALTTDSQHDAVLAPVPLTNYSTFFHFGTFVLNPYTIGKDHEIQVDGAKASAFLELVYNNRWAWDSERFQKAPNQECLLNNPFSGKSWERFMGTGYDFQGRLSYTFTSDDNPSGSTIVGSGDVAAEFTVAKHLWRQHSDHAAQSLNLELSYGAVSDRSVFDVHHRGLVGLGYVGSTPESILNNGRNVQYAIRLGGAMVEHVNFDSDSTRKVVFENDVPDFDHDLGLALESEVYFPILQQSFLTAGGRLYGNSGPNVWSMWIGFTTPLGKIGSLIPK